MKKKECIDLLLKIINDIRNENYAIEFINGGYSYSKEITTISKILDTSYFQNVLDENYSTYKISGKNLNNIEDISSFSLMECIVYLNWLWHIDGSGILTGIIYTKIKKYLCTRYNLLAL